MCFRVKAIRVIKILSLSNFFSFLVKYDRLFSYYNANNMVLPLDINHILTERQQAVLFNIVNYRHLIDLPLSGHKLRQAVINNSRAIRSIYLDLEKVIDSCAILGLVGSYAIITYLEFNFFKNNFDFMILCMALSVLFFNCFLYYHYQTKLNNDDIYNFLFKTTDVGYLTLRNNRYLANYSNLGLLKSYLENVNLTYFLAKQDVQLVNPKNKQIIATQDDVDNMVSQQNYALLKIKFNAIDVQHKLLYLNSLLFANQKLEKIFEMILIANNTDELLFLNDTNNTLKILWQNLDDLLNKNNFTKKLKVLNLEFNNQQLFETVYHKKNQRNSNYFRFYI